MFLIRPGSHIQAGCNIGMTVVRVFRQKLKEIWKQPRGSTSQILPPLLKLASASTSPWMGSSEPRGRVVRSSGEGESPGGASPIMERSSLSNETNQIRHVEALDLWTVRFFDLIIFYIFFHASHDSVHKVPILMIKILTYPEQSS